MTLANFNSNFNWQLRMLRQAAECCGVIPDNPPPLQKCIWLGNADNGTNTMGIENPLISWTGEYWVNGVNGQQAYQPELGVFSQTDLSTPTTFFIWSLEDGSILPGGWTYDSGTGPVNWTDQFCDLSRSCYRTEGTFDPGLGSLICQGLTISTGHTLDFLPDGLDAYNIDDPVIVNYLQGIFGGQALVAVNVDYILGTYSIKIDNCYDAIHPKRIALNDKVTGFTSEFVVCVCADVLGFSDNPGPDGLYADIDSPILLTLSGGVFENYFKIIGTGSASGGTGGSPNFRSSTYISNPSSDYYQMIAVATFNYPAASKIQIWDPSPTPTPVLVTEFTFPSAGFSNSIYGPIAYDAVNDRIYFTILGLQMHYLDLATGTFTFVTNIGGTPSGNVYGYGMAINPVTNKKYTFASGVYIYPPDRGANQIFSASGVLENTFPFDSIYTTPDPTIDVEFAPTAGFVFDSAGYAYTVTSTQCTDYDPPFTQRDIVKLDPVTNAVVGILNYDPTLEWIPLSYANSTNQSVMQHYDGSGLIAGEKILVAYRNIGPSTGQTPTGNAWTNFPGTITRLVAFDTAAPYASSVILELPDSTYGTVTKFFYSYQFNKIFTNNTTNELRAFDLAGNVVYMETTPTYNGANVYEWYDLPFCNRVFGMNAEDNPDANLIVIEPGFICPENRIIVDGQVYEFIGNEWVLV